MKFRQLTLAAAAALTLGASASAMAQAQQFFPVLSGRTGPVAPNATPWANGHNDYMKLVNARGGINGVMTLVEECETGYATDKGVECYERLKGKNGGATVFQPLSTGITFALTEKAPGDKIPLITAGYGRSESADGGVFKWNFPLTGTYWDAADVLVQHVAKKEGGLDKLKGKKIALVYHDSPYGKEPIPLLQERSKLHGFDLQLLPVTAPGVTSLAICSPVGATAVPLPSPSVGSVAPATSSAQRSVAIRLMAERSKPAATRSLMASSASCMLS